MKLIDQPKYSSVLSKRSVDSKQKNRRCKAKESTILFKRSDDAKRKQSIYSQISINCYGSRGSNTGQNIVTSQFFHLGFVKLSHCCLSVCGFIWSNTVDLGGFEKDTYFFDEIRCPYESSCDSLSHLCQGKGVCFPIYPNWHNELIELFKNNTQSISTEPSK